MFRKGMTLIEVIVGMALVLIVITVSMSCIVPSFKNYKNSQEESALMSNVHFALRTIERELKYSDVSGMVIMPQTYTYPANGETYPSFSILFPSILAKDGSYSWDDDGNPYWQKTGIFYLENSSGNLYYQENFMTPTVHLNKPAGAFAPRHGSGPDSDRLITRNIGKLLFTDTTSQIGITSPAGDYIKIHITGISMDKVFPLEASVYAKRTR